MTNSIFWCGGNPGKFVGNKSGNSHSSLVSLSPIDTTLEVSTMFTRNLMQPPYIRSLAFSAEIISIRGPLTVPANKNGTSPSGSMVTIMRLQSIVAPYFDYQSIPRIMSKLSTTNSIRSTDNSLLSISTGNALTHLLETTSSPVGNKV